MTAFSSHRQFLSWGRVLRANHEIATPRFLDELPRLVAETSDRKVLAVGLGRSYGDSCLNAGERLIDMTRLDRLISIDVEKGTVRAEAGLALGDLLRHIVPKGWFTTTTPGTRFVTLGGAVSNDVHGKNHHSAGSFGCGVMRLGLLRSGCGESELTPNSGGELFRATIGGLGLTGVITTVELKVVPIRSAYLDVERIAFGNVCDFFRLAAESAADGHEHTVAWADCANGGSTLGRGIFMRGRWLEDGELTPHSDTTTLAMPLDAPELMLNALTVRLFNSVYYRLQKYGAARQRVHYAPFFYPLNSIYQWNRLYGARGFYQYQCLVPPPVAEDAIEELLRQITRSGAGSFLAVVKTLGPVPSPGMLSFPSEGATLALDFPNRGPRTLALLARLDAIVREAGGRLYPAKDGRMPADMFRAGYAEWRNFAAHVDPKFSSDFWRRVSA